MIQASGGRIDALDGALMECKANGDGEYKKFTLDHVLETIKKYTV